MDLLTAFVGRHWRRRLIIASYSVASLGCAWMAYLTWGLFYKSMMMKEAMYSLSLPLYPLKFLVPLCFVFLTLQSMSILWNAIRTSPDKFGQDEEGGL